MSSTGALMQTGGFRLPDRIRKIIQATLYEGYMLYPYRQSALKNRYRWNFGVLFPESYAGAETSTMQAECLLTADNASAVAPGVHFFHLCSTSGEPAEREITIPGREVAQLAGQKASLPFVYEADGNAGEAGAPLSGELELSTARLTEGSYRVTARLRNTSLFDPVGADREHALRQALISTHIVLHVTDGEFLSLIDPPKEHAAAAAGCRNIACWPVLVGDPGERQWMLAAPIVLYDYPQIAPESPGDFFDGTEIDELLSLRVLTLTDEEKRELRGGDPRTRAILERSEILPEDYLTRLHGALRDIKK